MGSLLVWVTKTESAAARGDGELAPGCVKLLLDGQQRITSLYGIIRGRPPRFFDGSANAFTGLYFNLEDEAFEFYGPVKMKDDPRWVSVSELIQQDVGALVTRIYSDETLRPKLETYVSRASAVRGIQDVDLHVEEVTGEDKTVDVVVDIFNQVNSGGTKLSKGDLALAKVCAQWPEARQEMRSRLDKWHRAGFKDFRLEWLLRCINTILTGEAMFAALERVDTAQFRQGLQQAEGMVDSVLNMVSARLGLDHDRVLGSRYSFPLIVRYVSQRGGHLSDYRERDRLLYWYIHTFLWGRYAGSTESILNQDLALIEEMDGSLGRLVDRLRQVRGDLRLQPNDFWGWSRGTRFYPLLYMLTRVCHSRDWETGLQLSQSLLGHMNRLELHHIFPRRRLYAAGHTRPEVNALANFTFLTKDTNLLVRDRQPAEYLEEFAAKHPGAVESHWIPMDRQLWKVENYPHFLAARRELLAEAANAFLDSLLGGEVPEAPVVAPIVEREAPVVIGGVEGEDEERVLQECNQWVVEQGLPGGEYMYELTDPATGEPQAILDLAWPEGLQEGLSHPVALLIDEQCELDEIVNAVGYRFFTEVDAFRSYVEREILSLEPALR